MSHLWKWLRFSGSPFSSSSSTEQSICVHLGHRLKPSLRSTSILFFHHGEKLWGKSAISAKFTEKNDMDRMLKLNRVPSVSLEMLFCINGSAYTPVTAQLPHVLLFVLSRTGHGNCRFTTKCFPMIQKLNGSFLDEHGITSDCMELCQL